MWWWFGLKCSFREKFVCLGEQLGVGNDDLFCHHFMGGVMWCATSPRIMDRNSADPPHPAKILPIYICIHVLCRSFGIPSAADSAVRFPS